MYPLFPFLLNIHKRTSLLFCNLRQYALFLSEKNDLYASNLINQANNFILNCITCSLKIWLPAIPSIKENQGTLISKLASHWKQYTILIFGYRKAIQKITCRINRCFSESTKFGVIFHFVLFCCCCCCFFCLNKSSILGWFYSFLYLNLSLQCRLFAFSLLPVLSCVRLKNDVASVHF